LNECIYNPSGAPGFLPYHTWQHKLKCLSSGQWHQVSKFDQGSCATGREVKAGHEMALSFKTPKSPRIVL